MAVLGANSPRSNFAREKQSRQDGLHDTTPLCINGGNPKGLV